MASWLGAATVAAALAESTHIRRAQALADGIAVQASGVRQAVTDLLAADAAAAQAVSSR